MYPARNHIAHSLASLRAADRPGGARWGMPIITALLLLLGFARSEAQRLDPISRFRFIENRGQWDPRGRYLLDRGAMRVWMGAGEAVYVLGDNAGGEALVRQRFVGGAAEPRGEGDLSERWGFDLGGRSAQNAGAFAEVRYRDLYPGVDARYYEAEGSLKYDLIVAPGADPAAIRLSYDGARAITIAPDGSLVLATTVGELREEAPFCYQMVDGRRRPVPGRFVRDGRGVGFAVGAYDRGLPLVIDPTLIYSSYLGGTLNDAGRGITVDATGNIYVTGTTISDDFPTGATGRRTSTAIFVAKLDPTGGTLLAARVIDGSGADEPSAIRLRRDGSVVIAGTTFSGNLFAGFPSAIAGFRPTPYDSSRKGDGFVIGLTGDLSSPRFYTYFGGSDSDRVEDMALDAEDSIAIVGWTRSDDLPLARASQTTRRGEADAFLAELWPNASVVEGCTYLGGTLDDRATALAAEPGGAFWVTGWTASNDFRTATPGSTFGPLGGRDCFLARVWFHGTGGDQKEIIGGGGDDEARAIAVRTGAGIGVIDTIYITGRTRSIDYPVTTPAGPGSWFITRIVYAGGAGASLEMSRVIGGGADNGSGESIQLGADGNIYLSGWTTSSLFPLTPDAIPAPARGPRGGADIAFVRLDGAGALVHASVVGGTRDDVPWRGSFLSPIYDLYITGSTFSVNLPLSRGAYDSLHNRRGDRPDSSDAFVMRFAFKSHPTLSARTSHIFDTLWCGTSTLDTLFIYNVGDADLVINQSSIDPAFFEIIEPSPLKGVPDTVRPGDSLRYIIRFNARAVRTISTTLFIRSNDPQLGSTPFKIAITAVRAVPALNAIPDTLRFEPRLPCLSGGKTMQVKVDNGGLTPVTIVSLTRADNDPAFQLLPFAPATLPAGGSFNLQVIFRPTRSGTFRDVILIRVRECDSTFRIPIVGVGDSLAIAFTPASVDFGLLPTCVADADTVVTLTNRGGSTLHLQPGQSPVIGPEFTRVGTLPDSIRTGESVQIRVRFHPLAGSGTGSATLRVAFQECGHTAELPLEGERTGGTSLGASVDSIDFGLVQGCAGAPAREERTVMLYNHGNGAINVTLLPAAAPFSFAGGGSFSLAGNDSAAVTVRYEPSSSGDDASVLVIPFTAGPCADTLRIPVRGSRDSIRLEAPVVSVAFPPLLACDRGRDTSLIIINRSRGAVTLTAIDSTSGAAHLAPVGLPRTIAPGDTLAVRVAFQPEQTGDREERIVYRFAPCGDSVAFTLSGRKEGVAYHLREDRLDFPPRLACNAAAVIDSFLLYNTSDNGSLTIRSIRLTGSPELTADPSLAGRSIPEMDSLFIPIRFAPGTASGTFAGTLEVVLGPCDDTVRREITATLVDPALTVTGGNFGDVQVGLGATSTITLLNATPDTITLDGIDGVIAPFTIVDAPFPALLGPGDSLVVRLGFTPSDTLIYAPTPQARVGLPCAFGAPVPLFGRGVPGKAPVDTFCVDAVIGGLVGDTVELAIEAITPARTLSPPEDIIYWISYDEAALQLLGVDPESRARVVGGAVNSGTARIEERGATAIGAGGLRLRFRLLLGREALALVRLDSVTLLSGSERLGVCGRVARVAINSHCVVTTIVQGKYPNRLEDVAPNPSSTTAEITYQQLENARALLRIFDMSGREVLRPLDAVLPGGRYTVRFDVTDLPSGPYLYSIEAGEYRETKRMMVEK